MRLRSSYRRYEVSRVVRYCAHFYTAHDCRQRGALLDGQISGCALMGQHHPQHLGCAAALHFRKCYQYAVCSCEGGSSFSVTPTCPTPHDSSNAAAARDQRFRHTACQEGVELCLEGHRGFVEAALQPPMTRDLPCRPCIFDWSFRL